ncbi:hypothetical protein ISX56_34025, partial [Serratia ureilytica]|nr:hypothetical protein [Serratia ureilytica]
AGVYRPLAVAMFSSRRPIDFLWVALLALAAAMLIPARCRPQGEEEEAEQA